ncbi:MAG: hypothetical protein RLZZ54_1215 [Cyanobacteriota bacterium]|jgi:putative flippase GtrA
MLLKRKALLLIEESYLVRYLLSGLVVTAYSLIVLTLLTRINFYIAYIVVELTSNLIRCCLFEQFVFVRDEGPLLVRLKRYGIATLPVIGVNYLTYFLLPASPFIASLRAVAIAIVLGFILAKKVYSKDRIA